MKWVVRDLGKVGNMQLSILITMSLSLAGTERLLELNNEISRYFKIKQSYLPTYAFGLYSNEHDSAVQVETRQVFYPRSGMFDPLYDDGGCASSAVADGCHPVLARVQLVQERGQDSGSGAAEGMPEGDGSAERVHVCGSEG